MGGQRRGAGGSVGGVGGSVGANRWKCVLIEVNSSVAEITT
jgi:hypothetical protein